jgi:hypothetical protein
VVLTDDRARSAPAPEPPREVETASEAMRLNWFASVDGEKKEEDEVWDLTEDDELCPEDVHIELMAGTKQGGSSGRPAPPQQAKQDLRHIEIARNPEAMPPLPEMKGGPLGRRLQKAARRLATGGQAAAPITVKEAVARLSAVQTRDEVAEILLNVARSRCRRAALFLVQRDMILGWDASGDGVDPAGSVCRSRRGRHVRETIDAKAPLVCNPARRGRPRSRGSSRPWGEAWRTARSSCLS